MAGRENTIKVLNAMHEGLVDPVTVAEACLGFMSEHDVSMMVESEELLPNWDGSDE